MTGHLCDNFCPARPPRRKYPEEGRVAQLFLPQVKAKCTAGGETLYEPRVIRHYYSPSTQMCVVFLRCWPDPVCHALFQNLPRAPAVTSHLGCHQLRLVWIRPQERDPQRIMSYNRASAKLYRSFRLGLMSHRVDRLKWSSVGGETHLRYIYSA